MERHLVKKIVGAFGFLVAALFATLMFIVSFLGHESPVVATLAVVVPTFVTAFVVVAVWGTLYAPRVRPGRPGGRAVDLLTSLRPTAVWLGAVGYLLFLVVVAALLGEVPE